MDAGLSALEQRSRHRGSLYRFLDSTCVTIVKLRLLLHVFQLPDLQVTSHLESS